MLTNDLSTLVHLVGFVAGAVLYAMLGVMTLRERPGVGRGRDSTQRPALDRMALATAGLGLAWNLGGLFVYGVRDLTEATAPAWMLAIAFAALGFLPAVVIHAAALNLRRSPGPRSVIIVAYGLSSLAAGMQLENALLERLAPSVFGLRLLSGGYVVLTVVLAILTRRRPGWRRGLSAAALAAFAVTALHLSLHAGGDRWWVEIIGHQASIPLAIAILYQDYRFALADLFLKRALSLLALIGLTLGAYLGLVVPFLVPRLAVDPIDPGAVAFLAILWLLVAVSYPGLRNAANRFVDQVLLRRTDYRQLEADMAAAVARVEDEEQVLDVTCRLLGPALWVRQLMWSRVQHLQTGRALVGVASQEGRQEASAVVATAEAPEYLLYVDGLIGGRVLLSDDLRMLESAGRVAAHRIDALRLARERLEARVRENEILQLAAEAELRALRAQLNPHFLFNALTTIGYLMRRAPDRALETLYRLTDLLRAVLGRSVRPFVTLGEEMEVVQAYLAIEKERFEERLQVSVDIPEDLVKLLVPPLILQPVVENAVKHGIAPRLTNGSVRVSAHLEEGGDAEEKRISARRPRSAREMDGPVAEAGEAAQAMLCLSVVDTGVGTSGAALDRRRSAGFGLSSVERRLEKHFGSAASVAVRSAPGAGTSVEIRMPARRRADLFHARAFEVAS